MILFFWILLLVVILIAIDYAWRAFPIITGFAAKNLASGIFVQHRKKEDILKQDLGAFPFKLASHKIDEHNKSVTVSIMGLAQSKAIYRNGVGCTLVKDCSEEELKAQCFVLPPSPRSDENLLWPYGNHVPDRKSPAINYDVLKQAMDNVMHARSGSKSAYTRAVLVVYDGEIVGEQYAPGFNKDVVMLGWSISKSITSALIGILVKQGRLNVDAPAPVAEWKHTAKEKITIKHLLQQTSGLAFNEKYTRSSEVTDMLFKRGDMGAFTAGLKLKHEPGTVFNYSSGNSNILSRIIRETVGSKDYAMFPYTSLFHKLNMHSTLLEPDASGTYIGSSYSYATPRDFARFGLLYYNNGMWNGEQVLTEDWVKQTIQSPDANKRKHYGYQFWLNGYDEKNLNQRWYKDVPADMFFADGYGGQHIYIIPSKKLVVVRMGLKVIDENKFLKEVISAIDHR